jgi:DNA-binding IclR family transcriptional regulator
MAEELIPADIKQFLLAHIRSIAQLEGLLLLRSDPETSWDVAAVAARLYVAESEAGKILKALCEEGLISRRDDFFRYAPGAENAALVDRLVLAYARHLIPITNIIHERPSRIGEFANAFRLKKDG